MSAIAITSRWRLSSGACEAIKWLAFACMVVDHVNAAFYGRGLDWAAPVGRLAMPMFVLLFAYNLARVGADHAKLLRRLLVVGVIAQPLHALVLTPGHFVPLNILFTFAAGVAVVMCVQRKRWLWCAVICLLATVLVDYTLVGVFLVVSAWLFFRDRSAITFVFLGVFVCLLCIFNGNLYALGGVAAVWAAGAWQLEIPRHRWLFWVAYPVHLAVFAVLAIMLGRV